MKLSNMIIFALLFTGQGCAYQFEDLQIDNATCNLVKGGTENREVIYGGKDQNGMCFITVPTATFKQTYSYCSLSGVLALEGKVVCQFGYYDKKHEQVSFVGYKDNVCQFVCIRK